MPLGFDLSYSIAPLFLLVIFAFVVTLAVLLIRLLLAATRALNAYTDDRKLRTALVVDEFSPADETRAS
jgi:Ni/Fe-hydrogenase subunit HybB-like protein